MEALWIMISIIFLTNAFLLAILFDKIHTIELELRFNRNTETDDKTKDLRDEIIDLEHEVRSLRFDMIETSANAETAYQFLKDMSETR